MVYEKILTLNMYAVLSPNIALRSWEKVPFAICYEGQTEAIGVSALEFERLLLADGQHEITEDKITASLMERGLIRRCTKGEFVLNDWNAYHRYDNRYMPKMNIEITGRCNYNCLHCFNAVDHRPLQSELSWTELEKILDEAEDCGILGFTVTGGEPLLHPHIRQFIQGIYDRHMVLFELNTNGFYLKQDFLDFLKDLNCRPMIKISLDTLSYHDWMRGVNGAKEDAIRAFRLCIMNGFPVMAQININRKNQNSLLETLEFLDELGVGTARIIKTVETPRWLQNGAGLSLSIEEYYDTVLKTLREYIKKPRQMAIIAWQFVRLNPLRKNFLFDPVVAIGHGGLKPNQPICKGNRGMIAVGANGNVYPCMQISGTLDSLKQSFGNIKEDGLKKLLQDSMYLNSVCKTVKERQQHNLKCQSCSFFRYCGGGCPALALFNPDNYGDLYGVDNWKCLFFENSWWKKAEKELTAYKNLTPIH